MAGLSLRDVPGWDSFKQIEMVIAVEEHYKLKFTTRELDSIKDIDDLVEAIARRSA